MIFQVLKRKRRVNGIINVSKCYYLRYRFGDMPRDKFVSLGTSDKSAAEYEAKRVFEREQRVRAGLDIPLELAEDRNKPLIEHIETYGALLHSKRRNANYIEIRKMRLTKIAKEAKWERLDDITAASFERWRNANERQAPTTLNDFYKLVSHFMKWNLQHKRVPANPMAAVEKVSTVGDKRRERRTYSVEELRALVACSPYRGLVYFAAAYTGLRRNELSQLEWRDVDLKAGFIRMRETVTKNRKGEVQALHSSLVDALSEYKDSQDDVKPADRVFPKIPTVGALKKDQKTCGIVYVDEFGRYADFHSFRVTFCTQLSIAGVSQRSAQALMRHSSPELTANTYTDERALGLKDDVEKLPSLHQKRAHICAQICVKTGRNLSHRKKQGFAINQPEPPENKGSEALQSVGLTGFEPATPTPPV